ncbi:GerAB/ArcD/ProY family transporter [Paucisalibacillus sp. EB02]|uniref:GerAB/ArcD/ProY family transporter n=1 Tax=Paucisalibacillus sp. EB02 TaxID=1347087 RepID=UPI0005A667FC|nr:GerAB/ArcD/ProY family transporter [Paucisalibacillus sp. EB02]
MEINLSIKPGNRIQAFYLFFIITGIQLGVGIIGAPRYIFMEAERDSWLSILIAFVYLCLLAMCMFFILKQYENADYFGIQVDIFGKWLGRILGTILIIHFGMSFFSILLTYIEVIQLFIYHALPNLVITILIMILVLYTVFGGIRVVVGITFLLFLSTFWLLLVLYDPILRMNWFNLLPIFQTSFPDLLKGARATSYTLTGVEILMVIYPFIQNKEKAKLPVFLGLAYTTLMLLITTIVSIGYFSAEGLRSIDWALLILYKSASFTFIERLDYIVVVVWLMVILPNLALSLWAMSFGIKRLYKVPQKVTLWIITILILIIVNFFQYDYEVSNMTNLVGRYGFWITYVYPFILLPIVLVKKNWRKRKGSDRL